MSIREQHESPEFAVAMRGYDRLQVDEYVSQLNAWVAEAETRQSIAESFVADRDLHIQRLQQRVRELEAERGSAAASAGLADIEDHVATARAAIADIAETARAEAHRIVEEADEYRTAARTEVERLRSEHQRVLDQLTELRGSLEGLISAPAAVLAAVDDITGHRPAGGSRNGQSEDG